MSDCDPEVGPEGWSEEAVYDAEISPLVAKIIAICKREELPLLLSVCFRNSDDTGDGKSGCCTTHLPGPKAKFFDKYSECARLLYRRDFYAAFAVTRP